MGLFGIIGAGFVAGTVIVASGCYSKDLKRYIQKNVAISNCVYDVICPDPPEEKARRLLLELRDEMAKSGGLIKVFMEQAIKDLTTEFPSSVSPPKNDVSHEKDDDEILKERTRTSR